MPPDELNTVPSDASSTADPATQSTTVNDHRDPSDTATPTPTTSTPAEQAADAGVVNTPYLTREEMDRALAKARAEIREETRRTSQSERGRLEAFLNKKIGVKAQAYDDAVARGAMQPEVAQQLKNQMTLEAMQQFAAEHGDDASPIPTPNAPSSQAPQRYDPSTDAQKAAEQLLKDAKLDWKHAGIAQAMRATGGVKTPAEFATLISQIVYQRDKVAIEEKVLTDYLTKSRAIRQSAAQGATQAPLAAPPAKPSSVAHVNESSDLYAKAYEDMTKG